MFSSGFAYDAMRRTARAVEERRANRDYWREIRSRRKHRWHEDRPPLDNPSVDACIAAQLDHDVFLSSSRTCPECHESFILINVRGVELDTCLECGSFWLDAGEFGALTSHEEIITESIACGPSVYQCPVCDRVMEERTLSSPAVLRIDGCPDGHGAYFERGELMKLLPDPKGTQGDTQASPGTYPSGAANVPTGNAQE